MSGVRSGAEVRLDYWLACYRGARMPLLWGAIPSVERTAREFLAQPRRDRDSERRKLEYVERAAMRTIGWLLAQDDPGEAARGLGRPGGHYWKKWLEDRVWHEVGHFRPTLLREGYLELPAGKPHLRRVCDACGERAVMEDDYEQVSRCLACGVEAPHEALPF